MTAHTPRFTARAPEPAPPAGYHRIGRCTSIEACDGELASLVTRRSRTTHPETVAHIDADIDQVLERRLAIEMDAHADQACRIAAEGI